jgi:hypothetical protein
LGKVWETDFGMHFCKKHNCSFWDNCPICLYEDMAINPSVRMLCFTCKTLNEAHEHGCFMRMGSPKCHYA